jgi:hypothetical protein
MRQPPYCGALSIGQAPAGDAQRVAKIRELLRKFGPVEESPPDMN